MLYVAEAVAHVPVLGWAVRGCLAAPHVADAGAAADVATAAVLLHLLALDPAALLCAAEHRVYRRHRCVKDALVGAAAIVIAGLVQGFGPGQLAAPAAIARSDRGSLRHRTPATDRSRRSPRTRGR